jgi:ring-1,2-phenylacetyl-CoA epoxidase subunit PaaC
LVEQPNTDFAYIMCRQFLFDTYDYFFQQALQKSNDQTLAAIAAKTIKESTYHLRHSGNWIIRLGDGTPESNLRLKNAFTNLWCYVDELFEQDAAELDLVAQGIAVDTQSIKTQFTSHIAEIMQTAGMEIPSGIFMQSGGKKGVHTEHLGFLLAEMQSVHRSFPGVKW